LNDPRTDEFEQKVKWFVDYEFSMVLLAYYPELTKEPHEIDASKVTYI